MDGQLEARIQEGGERHNLSGHSEVRVSGLADELTNRHRLQSQPGSTSTGITSESTAYPNEYPSARRGNGK